MSTPYQEFLRRQSGTTARTPYQDHKLGYDYDAEREKDKRDIDAVLTNIPGVDLAAGATSFLTGKGFQHGRNAVAEARNAAKESMSPLRYGVLSLTPSVAASFALPGSTLIQRVLGTGATEAVRGFSSAGSEDEQADLGTMAKEGAVKGLFGAAAAGTGEAGMRAIGWAGRHILPQVARLIAKTPVAGPIATRLYEGLQEGGRQIMRGTSDMVGSVADRIPGDANPALRAIQRALEPNDITKIARTAEVLPGQSGSAPLGRLTQEANAARDAVDATKIALEKTQKRMKKYQDKVGNQAKRITSTLEDRAKQRAATGTQQMEAEASQVIDRLSNPNIDANLLRAETRAEQLREGAKNYELVRAIKPLATPPRKIYDLIRSDKDLAKAFADAAETKLSALREVAAKDLPATAKLPTVKLPTDQVGRVKMPKLDMELFDAMKQRVNDRIEAHFAGAETGIAPARGRALLARISKMEEEFIGLHPPAERDLLTNARAAYKAKYDVLDAIKDGLNLQQYSGNATTSAIFGAGKRDLGEFSDHIIAKYGNNPEAMEAFRAGGQRSIMGVLQDGSDAQVTQLVERLVGSPNAQLRTSLVYGDKMVRTLSEYRPHQIERTVGADVGPTLARIPKVQAIAERQVQKGLAPLQRDAEKLAKQLTGTAKAAKVANDIASIPFETAVAGTGGQAAETLANITYPAFGAAGQSRIGETMGSMIQSEIRKMTPAEAITRLEELRNNPATQRAFGAEIDRILSTLRSPGPVRAGLASVRPYLTGQLAASQAHSPW
jgi:hypothetical protein